MSEAQGDVDTDLENEAQESAGERIEALEREVAATKDKWLRAVAELDNYK